MSNALLHIKDSYYFEFPKALIPRSYRSKAEFPNVWVKNDDQFQAWEAERLYHGLQHAGVAKDALPDEHTLIHDWQHWQHAGADHKNFGKPFDVFLEEHAAAIRAQYDQLVNGKPLKERVSYNEFLASPEVAAQAEHQPWFARFVSTPEGAKAWASVKQQAGGREAIQEFKNDGSIHWSAAKIANYNAHLSGKVVLDPQPFGELRNMYEAESGFCISKFMILEVVISILLFTIFTWVAGKITSSKAPKGRVWNFFEVFLLFIRDQIARPAIGGHHEEHDDHGHATDHAHADHSHTGHGHEASHASAHHDDHHGNSHDKHAHAHHVNEGDRFVPLLWTIFFFVLFCNLFGAIPWLGAPTGSFATTLALAFVTFCTVVVSGMRKFGFLGFFANQVPSMDLPLPLAVLLKPMIFAIEMLGLLIKHLVLSIRLLANMVAGHLVILGIMGLAFGAEAALSFSAPGVAGWQWWLTATIAVLGATIFNILELFVAFLQAYIFTFLSALFIGAAVHKH